MSPLVKKIALGAGAVVGALVLVFVASVVWYSTRLPPLDEVLDYRPRQHLQVFTADGVEIAEFGSERRVFVPIDKAPKLMQDAVLAVEDWRFREHGGISGRALLRALWANLTGGMPQGASTITQQVARTFFLSTKRTPERKIKEALLALEIERRLNKDQILELYLNQIYLGQRAYGFGAAAQVYFGKTLDELDVAEAAMLAGLPQNPGYANPITNFERAKRRQSIVLQRMLDTGVIDEPTYRKALQEPLAVRKPGEVEVHAAHVAEMARQAVVERVGDKAYTQGIRVYTSLRAADQEAAYKALRRAVIAHEARQPWRGPEGHEDLPSGGDLERAAAQALRDHNDDEDLRVAIVAEAGTKEVVAVLASGETVRITGAGLRAAAPGLQPKAKEALAITRGAVIRLAGRTRGERTDWSITQWPRAEGAFVALDPKTGRVRALVGGFDFGAQQFNHVTQAWRQPGSSFKPFLYSAAFEAGLMPDTVVDDAPWSGSDANGNPGGWDPKNSDGRYDGPITLREALTRSKNMVSIRVVRQLGIAEALQWTSRFGFDPRRQPDNLTLALGAGSTTPMQLASAYAVFANGGWRVTPTVIERITDAEGQTIWQAPPPPAQDEETRAVPARNVFLVNSLLGDVTRVGTAARAQASLKRADLYGKTGTTNDAVDAWFAGFQPGVVAVAWMGYDEPRSLGSGESGGGLALPMWIDAMQVMLRGVPVATPEPPEGVVHGTQDWRYAEWAEHAPVERLLDAAEPEPPAPAASAAASAPPPAASAAAPASAASR
ncbi:penicillin-binding protein 1A [Rubrivivax gelatinosus]|uniref:Penicillin-binding protein 1A n=1 Tax=Rubrivivax gelatinosus TaxID=28068 RepID=A0A4R2LXV4_RUBGE|nr:PBP1A family penicillin-binding protein [Rubrivivax gelatinosus]MBK1690269.1 penicillin-binding protein [Rubrivivax gelatinosus]TCO97174.1 penicillin-binding protein 1A [Rubrivivax gelatinosus]